MQDLTTVTLHDSVSVNFVHIIIIALYLYTPIPDQDKTTSDQDKPAAHQDTKPATATLPVSRQVQVSVSQHHNNFSL